MQDPKWKRKKEKWSQPPFQPWFFLCSSFSVVLIVIIVIILFSLCFNLYVIDKNKNKNKNLCCRRRNDGEKCGRTILSEGVAYIYITTMLWFFVYYCLPNSIWICIKWRLFRTSFMWLYLSLLIFIDQHQYQYQHHLCLF